MLRSLSSQRLTSNTQGRSALGAWLATRTGLVPISGAMAARTRGQVAVSPDPARCRDGQKIAERGPRLDEDPTLVVFSRAKKRSSQERDAVK